MSSNENTTAEKSQYSSTTSGFGGIVTEELVTKNTVQEGGFSGAGDITNKTSISGPINNTFQEVNFTGMNDIVNKTNTSLLRETLSTTTPRHEGFSTFTNHKNIVVRKKRRVPETNIISSVDLQMSIKNAKPPHHVIFNHTTVNRTVYHSMNLSRPYKPVIVTIYQGHKVNMLVYIGFDMNINATTAAYSFEVYILYYCIFIIIV